jgi:hypothetical protein
MEQRSILGLFVMPLLLLLLLLLLHVAAAGVDLLAPQSTTQHTTMLTFLLFPAVTAGVDFISSISAANHRAARNGCTQPNQAGP